jgi:hypothetical protein
MADCRDTQQRVKAKPSVLRSLDKLLSITIWPPCGMRQVWRASLVIVQHSGLHHRMD